MTLETRKIILYDSPCPLCNRFVLFALRNHKEMYCAGLDSNFAKARGLSNEDPESIIYLYKGQINYKSTAVLNILSDLGGLYRTSLVFMLIPRFIRDCVYDLIARNRYRIRFKSKKCPIFDKKLTGRILK